MNFIKKKFDGLKLNIKFTVIIVLFVAVSMAAFMGILFYSMENNLIDQQLSSMEYNMDKSYDQILKNVDSVNMSTQMFLGDTQLQDFLRSAKGGEELTTEEIIKFYNQDISNMERMVNNNPYLYQIRVYAESDSIQEMMPILYKKSRMNRLAWGIDEGNLDDAAGVVGWHFDYADRLFEESGLTESHRIMSLVSEIEDYDLGVIGTLEVAMDMETMFPELYSQAENTYSCFVDVYGNMYFGNEDADALTPQIEAIIAQDDISGISHTYYSNEKGQKLIVGYTYIRELGGTMISVHDISEDTGHLRSVMVMYVFILILLVGVLSLIINWIVKNILHDFYEIIGSIRMIQKGNLDVVIPDFGTSEMGELADQINKMMTRIRLLMEENLNRELLQKNSEIRALQNQINAHFIYNVLESIKMMAEISGEYDISDSITALGRLLRYSMKWKSQNVTVREEVEYIQNYLQLMNLRYDYEIILSLNIPEELYDQEIPKMSLQPIVENAIYHGIEELAEDTTIYIKAFEEGGNCCIEITDSGRGMDEEEVAKLYKKISGEIDATGGSGNGIGLKNVQDRIHMNFGTDYGLEIASKLGCFTKIMVRLPKRVKEKEQG